MGAQAPLDQIRKAVLELRASKGMVLNDADPDSVSCGSFFTNPIVSDHFARTLPAEAPR
jgi:UDP-N-acetylmuramate dehydrogenase